MQARHGAVERAQPLRVGGRVRPERALEDGDGGDRVARVLPPVRVVGLHQGHDGRVAARLQHPLVDVASRAHHDVGVGQRLQVVRSDLVVVRVGVRGQEPHDLDVGARDVPREVRRLRGGGDHEPAAVSPGGLVLAAGDDRDGAQQEQRDDEAGDHRKSLLTIILVRT